MKKDTSNINFFLPTETKKAFKLSALKNGKEMTELLINYVNKYVAKNTIADR